MPLKPPFRKGCRCGTTSTFTAFGSAGTRPSDFACSAIYTGACSERPGTPGPGSHAAVTFVARENAGFPGSRSRPAPIGKDRVWPSGRSTAHCRHSRPQAPRGKETDGVAGVVWPPGWVVAVQWDAVHPVVPHVCTGHCDLCGVPSSAFLTYGGGGLSDRPGNPAHTRETTVGPIQALTDPRLHTICAGAEHRFQDV